MSSSVERAPVKILVVDDELVVLNTLALILQRAGYQVATTSSGEQAVSLASKFAPDLLLADIHMPGMDGIEAAIQIHQSLPNCAILFISGHAPSVASVADRTQALAAEVAFKPIHPAELLRRLEGALQEAAGHSPTILYVDDDAIQRYGIVRVLTGAGYSVIEAETAEAGVRALSSAPDAVLLDIGLPDAQGFDVHRAMRLLPALADVPVIYVTSRYKDEASERCARELGAAAYFSLPLEPAALCACLQQQLNKGRSHAGASRTTTE